MEILYKMIAILFCRKDKIKEKKKEEEFWTKDIIN